jgi:HK97 family phage prohead protease
MEREIRSLPIQTEWRVMRDEGEPTKIVGHAAVFDKLSDSIMGFREKIAPGAFARSIKKKADVRALWNHDPNYVLGRTKSKTLKLKEDDVGLAIEIMPPDTQWANDLVTTIERGDVDQMSFGFVVVKESWEENVKKGESTRTLEEVDLYDVSPVTFPAYPQTDVAVRAKEILEQRANELLERCKDGECSGEHEGSCDVRARLASIKRHLELIEAEYL